MLGERDHDVGQQLERPARAARRRGRAGGGDQQRLLLAAQLALSAGARGLGQGEFQIAFHETPLGAIDRRAAGWLFLPTPSSAARRICARLTLRTACLPLFKRRQLFTASCLNSTRQRMFIRTSRGATLMNRNPVPCHALPRPCFTEKQGQYLAFIHAYTAINEWPPAEADMQRHFRVTPPFDQMVLTPPRPHREPGQGTGRLADPTGKSPLPS